MREEVLIRPYRTADQAGIRALHDRTPPAGSTATGPQLWPADLDEIARRYLAFWVAVDGDEQVVGMVGVAAPGPEAPPFVLWDRAGLAQVKRMRVAPERQRQGIGAALLRAVHVWRQANGGGPLIVETTVQQTAAVALYRQMGYNDVGRSWLGAYELIWLERDVMPDGWTPTQRCNDLRGQPLAP